MNTEQTPEQTVGFKTAEETYHQAAAMETAGRADLARILYRNAAGMYERCAAKEEAAACRSLAEDCK